MRVVIEVKSGLYDRIIELVNTGRYRSLSEFVDVSLRNQMVLEEDTNIENTPRLIFEPEIHTGADSAFLHEKRIDYSTIQTKTSEWFIEEPLWGQLNRFFPVKIICRTLAVLQTENDGKGIPLSRLHRTAAECAAILQKKLRKLDRKKKRKKSDKLSIALPLANREKSMDRFKNQFVGYLQTDGRPVGALSDMRFGVIEKDGSNEPLVTLTDAGLSFSSLENPVLDGQSPERTLANREVKFVIEHVKNEMQPEWSFLTTTLKWIKNACDRPKELTTKIAEKYQTWTQTVANTNRVGLLSRMHELHLIKRERDKLGVQYELTQRGVGLLK
jgi:Arc/MetJ-type ribon-helix-helix transcriptional regulator